MTNYEKYFGTVERAAKTVTCGMSELTEAYNSDKKHKKRAAEKIVEMGKNKEREVTLEDLYVTYFSEWLQEEAE